MINTLTQRSEELVEAFNRGIQEVGGKSFAVSLTAEPSWLEFKGSFNAPVIPPPWDYDEIFERQIVPLVIEFGCEFADRSKLKYRVPEPFTADEGAFTQSQIIIEAAIPFQVTVCEGEVWGGRYKYNSDADPARVWIPAINDYAHERMRERGVLVHVDAYVKPELELDPCDFPADERDLVTSDW